MKRNNRHFKKVHKTPDKEHNCQIKIGIGNRILHFVNRESRIELNHKIQKKFKINLNIYVLKNKCKKIIHTYFKIYIIYHLSN